MLKQNLGHSTLAMVERYLHIAAQTAAIRSQGFSPLDHLEVSGDRQFSHAFSGDPQGARGRFASTPELPGEGADEGIELASTCQSREEASCGPSAPEVAPPPSPRRRRGA